ncbi:MAG TPA: PepSY domain-containing protein [Bryobacteraceae bacterium]|nr:PepSY domain-containing protein [Bryobacteraceae bacterium]
MLLALLGAVVFAADKKVKLENLPPAVQAAVKEQTKNATLVGLSTEKENGKTTYEVETTVNGRSRDLVLDKTGAILETEDQVELNAIPTAAQAALRKRAGTGKIIKVEKLTAGSNVSYEAAIKTKAGKTMEAAVDADGTPHKED